MSTSSRLSKYVYSEAGPSPTPRDGPHRHVGGAPFLEQATGHEVDLGEERPALPGAPTLGPGGGGKVVGGHVTDVIRTPLAFRTPFAHSGN